MRRKTATEKKEKKKGKNAREALLKVFGPKFFFYQL